MKHTKIFLFFLVAFSLQVQAESTFLVRKLITVDDEIFRALDVKKVNVVATGFLESDVEVESIVLKTDRLILRNEIKDVELILLPTAVFGAGGGGSVLLNNTVINVLNQISLSGSNTGGG